MRKEQPKVQTARWTSTWDRQLQEFKTAEYALFKPSYRTKAPGGGGGGMPGGGGGGGKPAGGGSMGPLLAGTTSVVVLVSVAITG
jgi:hypothetical protein